jgi:ABC-2 type transport system ATP-binding protein
MDEANLCDRIALIQKGQILSVDTPAKIIESFPEKLYAVKSAKSSGIFKLLQDTRSYPGIASCFAFGDSLHATFTNASDKELIKYLHGKGNADATIEEITPGVEDCFIHLLKN